MQLKVLSKYEKGDKKDYDLWWYLLSFYRISYVYTSYQHKMNWY